MGSLTKIDVTPASRTFTGKTAILNDKAVEAFKSIYGVESVTPVLQQPAYLKSGAYINMVRLYGLDLTTADDFGLTPLEGTSPGDGLRLRPEVMLTEDVATTFSDAGADWAYALDDEGRPLVDPMTSPIRLTFDYSALTGEQTEGNDGRALSSGNFYPLRVTGICSNQQNAFSVAAFLDIRRLEELKAASSGVQPVKPEDRTYELVWIKVRSQEEVQAVASLIRETGLNTYSLNDMLETVRTQSRQIQGMLGAIGAVAMLVSAICVANTMMMSITERTREVGILKVLGASLSSISAMFLVEALLVGLLGGAAGLCLSYAMKEAIPVLFANQELRCVMPLWLMVSGVVFAGITALLAAMLPTHRAIRISPNEALRAQ